jgi:CO/xanthine dehydrogenase FAD-binding subunit
MSADTYTAAASVEEALQAMASGARPIAGGTDLVVAARGGKSPLPGSLVAIHGLAELRGIEEDGDDLVLRALATHADIVASAAACERFTALADASAIVGSHATRNAGTIGGNLMNASPAMETGGPLICFDATVTLQAAQLPAPAGRPRTGSGTRELRVAELFAGPGATTADAGELLTSVRVPAPAPGTGSCYARLEYRRQMEIAIVGATAVVTLDGGQVSDARIAITALAPTIRRVAEAEAVLVGSDGGEAAARAAADAAAAASQPISDVRGSADYRRAMAAVIARRAIVVAVARAGGQQLPIPASPALHGAVEGGAA